MSSIILASSSPARANVLREIGVRFRIAKPLIKEEDIAGASVEETVIKRALAKGKSLGETHEPVIAADTVVVVDGKVLGKPSSAKEAAAMLRLLSGRWHSVLTGIVVCIKGKCKGRIVKTNVLFRKISEEELFFT